MSLAIDVDTVTDVLLADGWHEVRNNSFEIDAYEFLWSGVQGQTIEERAASRDWGTKDPFITVHGGGNSGVCATGFQFQEGDDRLVSGPLTAVLAVRSTR